MAQELAGDQTAAFSVGSEVEATPRTIFSNTYLANHSNQELAKARALHTSLQHEAHGSSSTLPNVHIESQSPNLEPKNVMWTPKPVKQKLPKPESMDTWTDRLGGASQNSINKLVKRQALGKLTTTTLSDDKLMLQSQANQKAKPHKGQMPRCSLPGYKMWGDEQGPNVKSFIHHYRYVFGWLDDATNFGIVIFAQKKSEAINAFMQLKAWCPHKIHAITTDGAKEYFSTELQRLATNADIFWTSSPAYVAQRNSRMEHWWYRTDVITRYMLARCKGSKIFWAYAKEYAGLILNLKEYGPTGGVPFEGFMQTKFGYDKLRVFGCTVLIRHMTSRDQTTSDYQKYNMKSQFGFYLGFNLRTWKHVMYGIETKRIHEGPDFDAFEQNFHAIYLFQNRNPDLCTNLNEDQELRDLREEIESQGEKFDETQLSSNPFGISKGSREIWNKTAQSHDVCVDKPSVAPTDSTTRPEEIEQPQEKQTQPLTSTQPNPDVSTQQREPQETSDPMEIDQQTNVENSTQPTREEPDETRESIPEVDPSEVQQQRIDMNSGVQPLPTRAQKKADPTKAFEPTIEPSRANREVKDLIKTNKQLVGLLVSLMITQNEPITPKEKLNLQWQNNVEYSFHVFYVQGQMDGGYWSNLTFVNEKRSQQKQGQTSKRKRDHDASVPILGTAMPTVDGPEPQSFEQAKIWENAERYIDATEEEMLGHHTNGTYVPCDKPIDAVPIDSRFVYVRKINPDNTIRYKARWVARGFTQVAGENFNWDTVFAPVLRMTSMRWLFSLIAEHHLEVTSSDVVQAFLQADLKDTSDNLQDIYVKLPKGYETTCPTTGRKFQYGKLVKALYGLKQSPRRWAEKLTAVMKRIGFTQHPEDPCIYIYRNGKSIAVYGIYVDDMIKATNDPILRKRVDAILSKELKIEHQGELKEFLGMQFEWKKTKDGQSYLNVSQEKYCHKILKRFGMDQCKSKDTPCQILYQESEDGHKKKKIKYLWPNPRPPEEVDQELLSRYRAGIGALIYLSVMTRPDISYAVNSAAQFMSNPNKEHEDALWHIFRYLKTRETYSLKYFHTGKGMTMEAFVDANFMGDHDARSVTGRIIFSGNGIIDWGSNRQTVVATSTSHSECIGFFEMVKSVVYTRRMIKSFQMSQCVTSKPTVVFCDNEATVELARKKNEKPQRTKHWNMQWNWLHEQRDVYHQFEPIHKKGTDNWADVFTKPLVRDIHNRMVAAMRLADV